MQKSLRGFAFSLEALFALASLALLALLLQGTPGTGFASLRVSLAASDVAELLARTPAANAELQALAAGSPLLLQPRVERLAGALGVCLEVRAGGHSLNSTCSGGLGFAAASERSIWASADFLLFQVVARA